MKKWAKILLSGIGVIVLIIAAIISVTLYQHNQGKTEVKKEYQEYDPPKIQEFGATTNLSILPLVNWHTASPELKTEAGVSYLVKTDTSTILFDLGLNREESSPSPLEHNMHQLGIDLREIDMIFISHNHPDHVGGHKWFKKGSFSLDTEQKDLSGINVFTPEPMQYPGITPAHIPEPTVLAEGVASIGTIPRKLYLGRIDEQALAINVEGKGLVLIVGCGHQKLSRIIERTKRVFEEPIYGIIGDLHYPVPEGRLYIMGLDVQRLAASGEGPFNPLTKKDVMRNIQLLTSLDMGIIGIGGHDSSDEVIEEFKEAFGPKYRYVNVGKWIKTGSTEDS